MAGKWDSGGMSNNSPVLSAFAHSGIKISPIEIDPWEAGKQPQDSPG